MWLFQVRGKNCEWGTEACGAVLHSTANICRSYKSRVSAGRSEGAQSRQGGWVTRQGWSTQRPSALCGIWKHKRERGVVSHLGLPPRNETFGSVVWRSAVEGNGVVFNHLRSSESSSASPRTVFRHTVQHCHCGSSHSPCPPLRSSPAGSVSTSVRPWKTRSRGKESLYKDESTYLLRISSLW